jgi:integrase
MVGFRGAGRVAADHPARPAAHHALPVHAGVPISIVSKWAGHYDSAFTQKTYVHASDDDLQWGRATLAKIHKIA